MPNDSTLTELNNLKNNKLLNLNTLFDVYSIVIAYQNVRSLLQNIVFIEKDKWYNQCGILLLSETHTTKSDTVNLNGYTTLFNVDSDSKNLPRGIIGLIKSNINSIVVKKSQIKGTHNKRQFQCDLIHFSLSEWDIITGYKSPSTPNAEFKKLVHEIMTGLSKESKILFIGDFNFDQLSERGTYLI